MGKLLAAVDSGSCLKSTPQNVNIEKSNVSTDDSEEETDLPPQRKQRKKKIRKLSSSSDEDHLIPSKTGISKRVLW